MPALPRALPKQDGTLAFIAAEQRVENARTEHAQALVDLQSATIALQRAGRNTPKTTTPARAMADAEQTLLDAGAIITRIPALANRFFHANFASLNAAMLSVIDTEGISLNTHSAMQTTFAHMVVNGMGPGLTDMVTAFETTAHVARACARNASTQQGCCSFGGS
jgi:hypothetical protein